MKDQMNKSDSLPKKKKKIPKFEIFKGRRKRKRKWNPR